MASPLVETKLYLPRLRRNLVSRPRLSGHLGRAMAEARLTLISAPAGFGKTTLLAAWLADPAAQPSVAWLSLDEGDRRPTTFWTYVIAALQTVVPGVGAGVLPLLGSAQPPVEQVIAEVLNELSAVPDDIVLVLDDYHLVDGPDLRAGVTFLIEHLPPRVHLVISTRADPSLPLARLRARGELLEVRAADLRFTPDEVASYLGGVVGLELRAAEIAALEGRTEGWIAALQLAALSMQGRSDIGAFIDGFAGDDRYIVDYLVEEVLARQTDQVRSFLLRTSILDRLSGPLCDAVTGMPGGKATLESLDRANLFVVPLDDRRHWYRYHHLFADMLRAHLIDERPGEVGDLHRRASRWYDQDSQPLPAVRHAVAAGDVERAADLVELAIPALQSGRQESTIRGWLDVIPDEIVRLRPVLAIGFIGALMSGNEFGGVEQRLDRLEGCLTYRPDNPPELAPGMVVRDRAELARVPAAIEMYRTALALIGGDLDATVVHARLAMDRSAADDHVIRAAVSGLSGLASWTSGDLDAAHRSFSVCVQGLERSGHVSDVLGASITLADLRSTQGRLRDAERTFERGVRLGTAAPGPALRGTADMYVGLSRIACARGDLEGAEGYLQRSRELGEHAGLPQNPYRWRVASAAVREAWGDPAAALSLLDEAERLYVADFAPNVRPIPAVRAGVLAARGRLDEAARWAAGSGLSVDDDLTYVREFEHVTLARVLLAGGSRGAGEPVAGTAAVGGGSGRQNGHRHRDPGAAGPRAGHRPGRCGRAGPSGASADPRRTRGLRPGFRRRRATTGVAADGDRPPAAPLGLCTSTADHHR